MGIPPTIQFASIGMADSLILMVMALVVFGPRRLPQIGRQIGKLMYEFRKASNDFKFQMEEELRVAEDADRRKKDEERLKQLESQKPQESVSADPPPPQVNAIESPYPGEGEYPQTTPTEPAGSEEAAPRISDAIRTEETTLQVMPPSTGETVAAARPRRVIEPAHEDPGSPELSDQGQTASPTSPEAGQVDEQTNGRITAPPAAESSGPATEAVSHNG
jgi:sec-independent protein translocase protein TatB